MFKLNWSFFWMLGQPTEEQVPIQYRYPHQLSDGWITKLPRSKKSATDATHTHIKRPSNQAKDTPIEYSIFNTLIPLEYRFGIARQYVRSESSQIRKDPLASIVTRMGSWCTSQAPFRSTRQALCTMEIIKSRSWYRRHAPFAKQLFICFS